MNSIRFYSNVSTAEVVVLYVDRRVESESPHGRSLRRIEHHAMAGNVERQNKRQNGHYNHQSLHLVVLDRLLDKLGMDAAAGSAYSYTRNIFL